MAVAKVWAEKEGPVSASIVAVAGTSKLQHRRRREIQGKHKNLVSISQLIFVFFFIPHSGSFTEKPKKKGKVWCCIRFLQREMGFI